MPRKTTQNHKLFADPLRFYYNMLEDIRAAKKYILLETFRFSKDSIGIKFLDILSKKAKEGLEVKLLLDSWGTMAPYSFFAPLTEAGGEVRFFEKIRINWDFFTKSHRRDHRKLLIIDDKILYIGSANISDYSLNWRESVLRFQNSLAKHFKPIFLEIYERHKKYAYDKQQALSPVNADEYKIIRDVPSILRQPMKKQYEELIKNAQISITIVTPYFVPGHLLRKALLEAGRRGVRVQVIVPYHSDVSIVDLLRNKYLGQMYNDKLDVRFYRPHNLHAKIFIVDEEKFVFGSSNFDYRSFRYQHEINIMGKNEGIIASLKGFVQETINESVPFDYESWKRRPLMQKILEQIIIPFRHLL